MNNREIVGQKWKNIYNKEFLVIIIYIYVCVCEYYLPETESTNSPLMKSFVNLIVGIFTIDSVASILPISISLAKSLPVFVVPYFPYTAHRFLIYRQR